MSNYNNKRIKEYKELCGLTNEEIVELGNYPKSRQWVGQVVNGSKQVSDDVAREILNAISVARATKLRKG